jgi:hypothetical protein
MLERFGFLLLVAALELRRLLWAALEVLLALVLLFEEWGWRPLAELVGRLRRYPFWLRFEQWLAALPPYGALAMFAAPSVILFPLKLAGLWLVAQGHIVWATLLIGAAKVVGTAFVARVFVITRSTLMTIPWFARLYNFIVPWHELIVARLKATRVWRLAHALKMRAQRLGRRLWVAYGPSIRRLAVDLRGRVAGALGSLIARARR